MPLPAGTRVGVYEILSALGAGGMGEVYRARDTRLKREVALKVLPEAFASDPGRMMRFQREAEVLASLNHPNIAQIYGVEERALAMELVEGESPQGPMPFDAAWKIAMQIANALEYAHDKGVIHRDLKPANVKVTPEGTVKLLDFGLAKAYSGQPDNPSGDPSLSPTITLGATVAGTILGTAAYMAPEQARGKAVDKRADIWAWGVVLYELLTGEQMFQGEDAAETLGAVMHKQPDLERVPPQVRKLLGRCLEKDPKKRLRDIGDAKDLLEETAPSGRGSETRVRFGIMTGVAALMTVIAAIAVWGWLRTPPASARPVTRWQAPLPQGASTGTGVAISRDGTEIAYAAAGKLWLRRLDQFEAQPVSGADNGVRPVFSPDGKWLAYFGLGVGPLKKIPVTGGTPIPLCDNAGFWGGSWSDGMIVFSSVNSLMRVPEQGGKCEPLTKPPAGEIHRWPQILPGGQAVLFTAASAEGNLDTARIAVLDLKTGAYRTLVNGGTNGRYVPSGHLVYVRGGTLFAVPFDLKRLAVTGGETPVVEDVYYNPSGGFADYSFSDTGLLAYLPETRATRDQRILAWVDLKGAQQPLSAPANEYTSVRLSPDGQRAALIISGSGSGGADLWVYDLARGTLTRLTSEENVGSLVWTPDGRRIAFGSRLNGFGIHWVPADGGGKPEVLVKTPTLAFPTSWTPDGKTLLYTQVSAGGGVWTVSPGSGDGKPQPLFANSQLESYARVSPDGHWVAYQSNLSGMFQVYLRPFPGPGGLTPVSVDGGEVPMWSRDGRELFFAGRNRTEMVAVDVETSPALKLGTPRALFPVPPTSGGDVAPDGKRFLFAIVPQSSGNAAPAEEKLQVVENWFDELRRLAPAK